MCHGGAVRFMGRGRKAADGHSAAASVIRCAAGSLNYDARRSDLLPVSTALTSRSSTCWTRSKVSMISRICAMRPSRKRVEGGDVELHHPLVAALAEEHPDVRRDLVALGDQDRHLVAHARNSGRGWSSTSRARRPCRGDGPYAAGYRPARWRRIRRRRCSAPARPRYRRNNRTRGNSARAAGEDPRSSAFSAGVRPDSASWHS